MAEQVIDIAARLDARDYKVTLNDIKKGIKEYKDELEKTGIGTDRFSAIQEKLNYTLETYSDLLKPTTQEVENLNEAQLDGIEVFSDATRAASGLVSGFGAVKSIVALLGVENEALAKTFVQLQAISTLSRSLSQLGTGLKATTKLVKQFNSALNANVIVAVTAAVLALGAAFYTWYVSSSKTSPKQISEDTDEFINSLEKLSKNQAISEIQGAIDTNREKIESLRTSLDGLRAANNAVIVNTSAGAQVMGDYSKQIEETENSIKGLEEANKRLIQTQNNLNGILDGAKIAIANIRNETIQANEAKLGSDYRYTQAGRKAYNEYFDLLLAGYTKDSEEYRRATNQKLAYDREFTNNLNSELKKRQDAAKTDKEFYENLFNDSLLSGDAVERTKERLKQVQSTISTLQTEYKTASDERKTKIESDIRELVILEGELYRSALTGIEIDYKDLKFSENVRQIAKDFIEEFENISRAGIVNIDVQRAVDEYKLVYDSILQLQKEFEAASEAGDQAEMDRIKARIAERTSDLNNIKTVINARMQANIEQAESEQELQKAIRKAQGFDEDATLEEIEAIKEQQAQDEIDRLWELANNEKASYTDRQKAAEQYYDSLLKRREADLKDEQKKKRQKEQERQQELNNYANILSAGSKLAEDNAAASNSLATAGAIVNTYAAANRVLAEVPYPASIAAMASVIATGLANVKQIWSASSNSSRGNSGGENNEPTIPRFPEIETPIYGTSIIGFDTDEFNIKAYVSETDITTTQNRVREYEQNARY